MHKWPQLISTMVHEFAISSLIWERFGEAQEDIFASQHLAGGGFPWWTWTTS